MKYIVSSSSNNIEILLFVFNYFTLTDSKTVDQSNITENVGCKGKKKKKAKSKLLFSTDMSRG